VAYLTTKRFKNRTKTQGFSLLELLFVIGIITLITTIGLANYSQFNSRTLLDNLAYDVALSVREAQYYGISVREDIGAGDFDAGYGVYFDASDPNSYVFFVDSNRNQSFNGSASPCNGECLDVYTVGGGYSISDLCATPPGGTETCDLDDLTIAFNRPDPDAILSSGATSGYAEAKIAIRSAKGGEQSVYVASTGQIGVGEQASVSNYSPAPTCTLSASPSTIEQGNSVVLHWTSSNATSGSINHGGGNMSPIDDGYSSALSPSSNTTYTATVDGAGGTGNCTASVTVTQPVASYEWVQTGSPFCNYAFFYQPWHTLGGSCSAFQEGSTGYDIGSLCGLFASTLTPLQCQQI